MDSRGYFIEKISVGENKNRPKKNVVIGYRLPRFQGLLEEKKNCKAFRDNAGFAIKSYNRFQKALNLSFRG
jgi:hypothetical protein